MKNPLAEAALKILETAHHLEGGHKATPSYGTAQPKVEQTPEKAAFDLAAMATAAHSMVPAVQHLAGTAAGQLDEVASLVPHILDKNKLDYAKGVATQAIGKLKPGVPPQGLTTVAPAPHALTTVAPAPHNLATVAPAQASNVSPFFRPAPNAVRGVPDMNNPLWKAAFDFGAVANMLPEAVNHIGHFANPDMLDKVQRAVGYPAAAIEQLSAHAKAHEAYKAMSGSAATAAARLGQDLGRPDAIARRAEQLGHAMVENASKANLLADPNVNPFNHYKAKALAAGSSALSSLFKKASAYEVYMDLVKEAQWPFGDGNDPEAQAAIIQAKANYHKSRLRYQSAFRKLEPRAQRDILKSYDDYANTVTEQVRQGKYHITGGSLF